MCCWQKRHKITSIDVIRCLLLFLVIIFPDQWTMRVVLISPIASTHLSLLGQKWMLCYVIIDFTNLQRWKRKTMDIVLCVMLYFKKDKPVNQFMSLVFKFHMSLSLISITNFAADKSQECIFILNKNIICGYWVKH